MRAGGAFSYTTSQVDGNASSAPNTAKIESYRLIGYGSYNLDAVTDIFFQADVGISNTKGSRTINFAGATVANSDYQSVSTHLATGIGRSMPLSAQTTFTPSVSLSYSNIQDSAYTETGAGALNLKVGSNSADEMVAAIDGKLVRNLSETSKLSANIGAGYDLMAKKSSLAAAFAGGGGEFITNGLDVAPWSVRGGLGYISTSKTMEITARYDLELREGSNNQTVSVKFRMPF
jgi:outer membrane autotransporter protein